MSDLHHMEYIDAVAAADCDVLRRKESTYRGSWKRRGGRGAWHVFARCWDRLANVVEDAAYADDVFAAIEVQADGRDGTPLAALRDLRRYLLLVEAEMVARGVVVVEGGASDTPAATQAAKMERKATAPSSAVGQGPDALVGLLGAALPHLRRRLAEMPAAPMLMDEELAAEANALAALVRDVRSALDAAADRRDRDERRVGQPSTASKTVAKP